MDDMRWLDEIQWPAKIVVFRYSEDVGPVVGSDRILLQDEQHCLSRIGVYKDLELAGGAEYKHFYYDVVPILQLDEAVTTISRFLQSARGRTWTGESKRVAWASLQK